MNFKFRHKEYSITRDAHQFTLKELIHPKNGDEPYYTNETYYSDATYLVKRLIALHCVNAKDGREMLNLMKLCCEQLGTVLNRAVKASYPSPEETSKKTGATLHEKN